MELLSRMNQYSSGGVSLLRKETYLRSETITAISQAEGITFLGGKGSGVSPRRH